MKPLKFGMHIWIIITTIISFFAGLFFLSHSGKPAPLPFFSQPADQNSSSALQPLPTLPAIPTLGPDNSGSSQSQGLQQIPALPAQPQPSFNFPSLRTRGS